MIERAALLKAAASEIDAHDADIRAANDAKKDIFANIRESVAPELFKAWREAVKLRQKRKDPGERQALMEHDVRVWEVLLMLEATEQPSTSETPSEATVSPAIGHFEETAPTRARTRDAREDVPHDPATGEITEPQAAPSPVPAQAAPSFHVPSTEDDAGLTAACVGAADNSTPSAAECLPGAAADVEQGPEEVSPLASGPDLDDMAAEMLFAGDIEMPDFLKRRKAA
jgi:hypothetical protein